MGYGNYRTQENWWGPSAFSLFVELEEAVFGVLGLCIRKIIVQCSESKTSLWGGAGLWDRYCKSSSWSQFCSTALCQLSLDIKTWEPASSKKGNAEESSETLSNLEIVRVCVGDPPTRHCLSNGQMPLCVICSQSIALLLEEQRGMGLISMQRLCSCKGNA